MSEEQIVRHCSPTLAGLKTANMFSCSFSSVSELREEIRSFNRLLSAKGLRFLPLKIENNSALIYVYRPSKLKEDLSCYDALSLLEKHGYMRSTPERNIVHLIKRINKSADFPHEIGLFLGYPPEDVRGFIENNAKKHKFIGHWKVYGNEKKAKETFNKYKKCTEYYQKQILKGKNLEKLAIAV